MSRKTAPDDANRPPLPEGYIYDKHGKPISPREQLANVINGMVFDDPENFDKACRAEWKRLPQAERDARVSRVKRIVDAVIKEVTGSTIEPRAEDAGETEKRSWANATQKKRAERGNNQRD